MRAFFTVIASGLSIIATAPLCAAYYTVRNGSGDGQVDITLTETGYLGSALYNPVGSYATGQTIYSSELFQRLGDGRRTIVTGNLTGPTVLSADGRTLTSSFAGNGYGVQLTQTLFDLVENGVQTGSQLRQTYVFTNLSANATMLDLVRYLDGDLSFNGSRSDGGGRTTSNGATILFETDGTGALSSSDTFLGIYNQGGAETGYEVLSASNRSALLDGRTLANTVVYDANGDGVADQQSDIALALGSRLGLAGLGSATFTTYTLWGSGAPGQVTVQPSTSTVPEPSTWAMMVAGFGALGAAMRRRAVPAIA